MLDPHVTHLRPSRCANSVVLAVGLNRVNDLTVVLYLNSYSQSLCCFSRRGAFSPARSQEAGGSRYFSSASVGVFSFALSPKKLMASEKDKFSFLARENSVLAASFVGSSKDDSLRIWRAQPEPKLFRNIAKSSYSVLCLCSGSSDISLMNFLRPFDRFKARACALLSARPLVP